VLYDALMVFWIQSVYGAWSSFSKFV